MKRNRQKKQRRTLIILFAGVLAAGVALNTLFHAVLDKVLDQPRQCYVVAEDKSLVPCSFYNHDVPLTHMVWK